MFKFILLLVVLWLALRLVGRILRLASFVSRDERPSGRASSFSSSRKPTVEEAEFEVIESHIKEKE